MRGSYARFIDFSTQSVHVSRYKHILDQFGVKIRCAAASSRGTYTTACTVHNRAMFWSVLSRTVFG